MSWPCQVQGLCRSTSPSFVSLSESLLPSDLLTCLSPSGIPSLSPGRGQGFWPILPQPHFHLPFPAPSNSAGGQSVTCLCPTRLRAPCGLGNTGPPEHSNELGQLHSAEGALQGRQRAALIAPSGQPGGSHHQGPAVLTGTRWYRTNAHSCAGFRREGRPELNPEKSERAPQAGGAVRAKAGPRARCGTGGTVTSPGGRPATGWLTGQAGGSVDPLEQLADAQLAALVGVAGQHQLAHLHLRGVPVALAGRHGAAVLVGAGGRLPGRAAGEHGGEALGRAGTRRSARCPCARPGDLRAAPQGHLPPRPPPRAAATLQRRVSAQGIPGSHLRPVSSWPTTSC